MTLSMRCIAAQALEYHRPDGQQNHVHVRFLKDRFEGKSIIRFVFKHLQELNYTSSYSFSKRSINLLNFNSE